MTDEGARPGGDPYSAYDRLREMCDAIQAGLTALHAKPETSLEERVLTHLDVRVGGDAEDRLAYDLANGRWSFATLGAAIHVLRAVSGDPYAHVARDPDEGFWEAYIGERWILQRSQSVSTEREALVRAILFFLEKNND